MSINDYMNANRINDLSNPEINRPALQDADPSSVHSFNNAINEPDNAMKEVSNEMKQASMLLLLIIQMILEAFKSKSDSEKSNASGMPTGGSTSNGSGVIPINSGSPSGSAGNNSGISPPTEHIQTFNLGGKNLKIGGDGTASSEEVKATANTIQDMYQNSSVFKNMIDKSSDPSFEISVGRRSDNMSWGHTSGRIFMNVNNIAPGNSDTFQSLLAHEFAHASIDIGHGSQIEQIEQSVAQQA